MAKAYQCDRCGKLYKKTANAELKFVIYFYNTHNTIDLCPDCQEKIEKFVIEEGVNN